MLVQQECREYAYARRYLPHWRYVPDAALPALLEEDPDGP
jgi:maltokinase